MSTTVERTDMGVHVAMIKGRVITGYHGQITDADRRFIGYYDNTDADFGRKVESIAGYVGRHRKVTLRQRLLLSLGYLPKARQTRISQPIRAPYGWNHIEA